MVVALNGVSMTVAFLGEYPCTTFLGFYNYGIPSVLSMVVALTGVCICVAFLGTFYNCHTD